MKKKRLGQFFTISEELQQFIFDHVKNKLELLLEPSFGAGHLLQKFKNYNDNYPMICYEIDNTITPIVTINNFQQLIYDDFTKQTINQTFKTIIGNPPYVKQKTGNLYIKFIELCYNYLDTNGELLFIVPSDFLKLTSAAKLITKMTETGSFTDFLFPHDENLFDEANIDIVVFRYEKGLKQETSRVNGIEKYYNINNGIITFSDTKISGVIVQNLFNIYVGLVSGKDDIYKVDFGNVEILTDKDKIEKFILIDSFPCNNEQINNHLLQHKSKLLERRIKTFTDKNWFEWGAPRNIETIKRNLNKPCIYVKNLTRKKTVAFIGEVQYFGGSLLCMIPKNDLIDLVEIVNYLNSELFQKEYLYAGRFKIGHKQLANAILPV
jgi:adenine-specific DNA-methyltransferase